ncbi:MAG TPA: cyclic nucleotide-binding domain-containing protein [bacterium]
MRVPVLNTDPQLEALVRAAFAAVKSESAERGGVPMEMVSIDSQESAIEYITYQMPALIVINFSDKSIDGMEVMSRLVADPWLNNGGIVALYGDSAMYTQVDGLQFTNILISLDNRELSAQLPTVLQVIANNRQILCQRSIQSDLLNTISGTFTLGMDLLLIPCYANLVANYLYNMGFVDGGAKTRVALMLSEMLINAIEHGNCGITAEEKVAYIAKHGEIRSLIAEKCRNPKIAGRTVLFTYTLSRDRSHFVIRDEGPGFNWREYVKPGREVDFLAQSGRGILLTRETVSQLSYNNAGNEVTLELQHRLNSSNEVPSAFRDNETVIVAQGDVVFRQGEESSFIYYLAEGEYQVVVNGRPVGIITPEDVLMGEMSFLLEETRSATVIANTPGKLVKISKESLVTTIKRHPHYGMFIAKLLAQRLVRQNTVRSGRSS